MLVPQPEHFYSISSEYHEGFFWEKTEYTQFLCSSLAALLHELMPHHLLV